MALLSLIGYDTSVLAALARLHLRERLVFQPAADVAWAGPRLLERVPGMGYQQFPGAIANTREKHVLLLPHAGNIGHGLLHPQDIPDEPKAGDSRIALPSPAPSLRFVLGNLDEDTPHRDSFLGHLRALRVIFLRRHASGDDEASVADAWASQLWIKGLERKLITPIPALGVKAWALAGDVRMWSPLISDGVRARWLPWQTESRSRAVAPTIPVLAAYGSALAAGAIPSPWCDG
ncbi:MAG TPA: hypothetical protein VFU22_14205 [Roseiflexaceae bacterium]|nr:hypothetical protein [Roseiflexaceae bacterium]